MWRELSGESAESAGTHPAERVNAGAVAAAGRAGLDVAGAVPRELAAGERFPALVVTVCDRAHEELEAPENWLHWSIPDPVPVGTKAAFDGTVAELRERIGSILDDREFAS